MERNRVPQGIKTGGQFAATSHGESPVALKEEGTELQRDMRTMSDALISNGMDRGPADQLTAAYMSGEIQKELLKTSRDALSKGRESEAGLLLISASAMNGVAGKVHEAASKEEALERISKARASLKSSDSLLGGFHHNGTTAMGTTDKYLSQIEGFLKVEGR